MLRGLAAVAVPILLAGCLTTSGPGLVGLAEEDGVVPRVVVGFVDSGINPYHDVFQDPDAVLPLDFVDAGTGKRPVPVRLSREGDFWGRLGKDEAVWNSLERGVLYWFEGTRILGISFAPADGRKLVLDTNSSFFHGTGVADVARGVAPDAWLVMVQIAFGWPDADDLLLNLAEMTEGVEWLAAQPWVDVVSMSVGFEGNPPSPEWEPLADATLMAWQHGKLVLIAASNLPTPTLGGASGPPWIVAVGGVEPSKSGEQPQASKLVDVVSDFTRTMAGRSVNGSRTLSGTSFGTPLVAGVAARALLELRADARHDGGAVDGVLCPCLGREVRQADLRAALNASAEYWGLSDYDPLNFSQPSLVDEVLFATIPVLPAPWVQMGWGYVGEGAWPHVLAVLKGEPAPPKPPEAIAYMAQYQALREDYWSDA